jgi:hypothetical protein
VSVSDCFLACPAFPSLVACCLTHVSLFMCRHFSSYEYVMSPSDSKYQMESVQNGIWCDLPCHSTTTKWWFWNNRCRSWLFLAKSWRKEIF